VVGERPDLGAHLRHRVAIVFSSDCRKRSNEEFRNVSLARSAVSARQTTDCSAVVMADGSRPTALT
jgi:hypothetical protein